MNINDIICMDLKKKSQNEEFCLFAMNLVIVSVIILNSYHYADLAATIASISPGGFYNILLT